LEVFRVRGKILSLALILAMFGAFFVPLGKTQTPITVYCDPALVSGVYSGTFDINIRITGGESVYAWEFKLDYPAYVQQISVIDVIAGDYLGPSQWLSKNIDYFNGDVLVGSTMTGDIEGAYGDGMLATVRFTVIEPAGEFPIDLVYARIFVRVDAEIVEVDPLDITVLDSYFVGPHVDFINAPGEPRNDNVWRVGHTRRFKIVVRNPDPTKTMYVRAKYTSTRTDGRVTELYSGQHLYTSAPRSTEYYYVNEFTAFRLGWNVTGTSPYLDAEDDGSYVTGYKYCNTIRYFGFENIELNPGDIIYSVTLEGLTRSGHKDIDYDVYDASMNWYGSLWGGDSWLWHNVRWTSDTVDKINPAVATQEGFNSFQLMLHYYTPDGSYLGPADIDTLRLRVDFIGVDPIYPSFARIRPGGEHTLDFAIWDLYLADAGTYTTTVTIEYKWVEPDPRFPQYWAATPVPGLTLTWTAHGA